MASIGFHASHEQIPPRALLRAVQMAEEAGFQAAMCSDHFSPWSERQGESGFAWTWLGAALQSTGFTMGVVNAPGQRYHPAIIAQAAASLAQMFPGRFWIAVGSGEAINEHITGEDWPEKHLRNERLRECVDVMRALFAGELVTHYGLIDVERARLWTLPDDPPAIIGAAVSVETAGWVGEWADGLITINQPLDTLRRLVAAFRESAGDDKPVYIQVHLSYADTDEEALAIAHDQWRGNVFAPPVPWDLELPEHFDEVAKYVRPEDVKGAVLCGSDPAWHLEKIRALLELDPAGIYLHHVGKEQERFIDVFADRVVPEL